MAKKNYRDVVDQMADKYGVPREYVQAIYDLESSGGKNVGSSSAGARGHMQLMPGTAREMGVSNIDDPLQNIEGGVKYYAQMLRQFKDPVLAAAAYNAGPGNVRKAGGVPRFRETQDYVRKFVNLVGGQNLMQDVSDQVAKIPDARKAPKVAKADMPETGANAKVPEMNLKAETDRQFAALLAGMAAPRKRKPTGGMGGILAGLIK